MNTSQFEIPEPALLQDCWVVVRLHFETDHEFFAKHTFKKPVDKRLQGLNQAASKRLFQIFSDVVVAVGFGSEMSFIIRKDSVLGNRQPGRIGSIFASAFAAHFATHWTTFFTNLELETTPMFEARTFAIASDQALLMYLQARQRQCNLDILYKTCFACLLSLGVPASQAEKNLAQLVNDEKEMVLLLRTHCNVDYASFPLASRRGVVMCGSSVGRECSVDLLDSELAQSWLAEEGIVPLRDPRPLHTRPYLAVACTLMDPSKPDGKALDTLSFAPSRPAGEEIRSLGLDSFTGSLLSPSASAHSFPSSRSNLLNTPNKAHASLNEPTGTVMGPREQVTPLKISAPSTTLREIAAALPEQVDPPPVLSSRPPGRPRLANFMMAVVHAPKDSKNPHSPSPASPPNAKSWQTVAMAVHAVSNDSNRPSASAASSAPSTLPSVDAESAAPLTEATLGPPRSSHAPAAQEGGLSLSVAEQEKARQEQERQEQERQEQERQEQERQEQERQEQEKKDNAKRLDDDRNRYKKKVLW
jgi:tRNA(His) 5'-end guanylyltransferase